MDINIPSAAPAIYNLGIDDQSTTVIPRIPLSIPKHCPKVFSLTQTGPEEETLVTAADLLRLYGLLSFDCRSIYTTHQSPLIVSLVSAANMFVMKRVCPVDAKQSFVTLYMDVLASTAVDNYARDVYGNIQLDVAGNPVPDTTSPVITGYHVKFTYDSVPYNGTSITAPTATPFNTPGTQTAGGNVSKRYPIATFVHSFKGKIGDNTAVRIWPLTTINGGVMPLALMDTENVYPYNFSVLTRPDANSSYVASSTLTGGKQIQGILKEAVYDKVSDAPLYVGENFLPNYRLTDDPSYAKVYGDLSQVTIYQKNIDLLQEQFITAEIAAGVLPTSDFLNSSVPADAKYLFNIFGLTTSAGQPYKSVVLVDSTDSVRLSSVTQIPLGGGSDGTILDSAGTYYDSFDKQVAAYMTNYADPENVLQDLARNVESEVYDTGFSIATKKELAKIILIRKNTIVHESTFVEPLSDKPSVGVGGNLIAQTSSEASDPLAYHLNVGMILRNFLAMMPESEYFGTSVARATMHPGSYLLRNSKYKRRISPIIDYAYKRAKYMGAADGQWKYGEKYDGAPGSIIELGYDIWPTFVPKSQVFNAWSLGLVFVAQYDLSSFHFPVNKTVYDNDTSILNSDMVISAIAAINTTVAAVDRMFKGVEGIDPALLAKNYNDEISARLKGCFDGKYRITPMAQFTSMDSIRGYSITVPVKIEGSVPNSVMTTYVIASRYTAA